MQVQLNGVDFSLLDAGAGPPVLLVHGFPLNHTIWDGQIGPLARHCRRHARRPARFRRHRGDARQGDLQQHCDDLAALLDARGIAEPVVLGGLSMGGYIAFQFFQSYRSRLRALMLLDTRAAADTPQAARGRWETADRVEKEGPKVLAELMLPRLLSPLTLQNRPDVVERVERMILSGDPAGQAAAARAWPSGPISRPCCRRSIVRFWPSWASTIPCRRLPK